MSGFSFDNLISDPNGFVSQLLQGAEYNASATGNAANRLAEVEPPVGQLLPALTPEEQLLALASTAITAPVPTALPSISPMPLAENLANVQNTVTRLMATDPSFRDAVGFDPLAADSNGWNLPKTGKVNTTGASQRVNARTNQTGVRAVKEDNGSLLLTNAGADGTFASNPSAIASPGSLTSSIAQLRKANTSAEAAVILENINSTIAAETAKANKSAIEFSENAVGIPLLQRKIFQSEQMDKNSPNWAPGMGDSALTKQLKGEMQQARALADRKATEFLQTSPTLGILNAQKQSAAFEMKRIDAKEVRDDKTEQQRETFKLNKDYVNDSNVAKKQEELAAVDAAIEPKRRQALALLNPTLMNTKDEFAYAKEMQSVAKTKDSNKLQAIDAFALEDNNKLIALAVTGNATAKTLLATKATNKEEFQKSLENIGFLANPANAGKYLDKVYGKANSAAKAEEAKLLMQETPKDASTADKETYRMNRIAKAINAERKAATDRFVSDTSSWKLNIPEWDAAVAKTIQERGTSSFDAVLNNYMGSTTGASAAPKLKAIRDAASSYIESMPESIFGKPDSSVIVRKVNEKAKNSGIGAKIASALSNPFGIADAYAASGRENSLYNLFSGLTAPTDSAGNLR